MITEADDFFSRGCGRCKRFATPDCSTRRWSGGLEELRRICLAAGLTETVKWGHPCYMHADRNIAIIGAFRDDFRLTFFDAAMMTDPEGVLETAGPNSRHAGVMRFAANDRPAEMETVIRTYLGEAMGYAEAGVKPPREEREIELPDELVEALDSDPELAEAFHGLTPGRQRSYVIRLSGAKKSATRASLIEGFRDRILAGRGANER